MSGGEERRAYEAKRAAYSARHEALEQQWKQSRSKAPQEPPPRKERWRETADAAVTRTTALPRRIFRAIKGRLPAGVKQSRMLAPARYALRLYRRRRPAPPPPPAVYQAGPPQHSRAPRYRRAACERNRLPAPAVSRSDRPKVCALVLNRNGAEHLSKLFASLLEHNTYAPFEMVVVDHGSTDGSRELIERYRKSLRIKAIYEKKNYSFSRSNNVAARSTDAELLLCLNNDIIFDSDPLFDLVRTLDDPSIGLAGIDLRYPSWHEQHPGGLQHGGIKILLDANSQILRPYNLSCAAGLERAGSGRERFPAMTAALFLMRKSDFEAIGGFEEEYFYGFEDVDLCFRIRHQLKKHVVCVHDLCAIHDESASQRKDDWEHVSERRARNRDLLDRRFGLSLRRDYFADKLESRRFLTDEPLIVGIAVTELPEQGRAGDAFTALELAEALERAFGWDVRLLPKQPDWYDASELDVLIAMVNGYDVRRVHHKKPTLLTIAWIRNWFDRWASQPHFAHYDLLLSSSEKGARWLLENHHRSAHVLRIAANPERMQQGRYDPALASDYCFTGHYWGAERDIEQTIDPDAVSGTFAVYGAGWENVPALAKSHRGPLPYARMPDVYASTRIVVDDSIPPCRPWGSVNSRVFDALAAGTLVVTNGDEGAREIFGDEAPIYRNRDELTRLLGRLLADEPERRALAERLRAKVLASHTYAHRAQELKSILEHFHRDHLRIAIKVPAPSEKAAPHWGDYHFALALRRCFWRRGHAVRIDLLPDWEGPERLADDVVLVLRGLSRYRPDPKQVNLMWNISHPDKVSAEEYEEYDHVFIASETHARALSQLKVPVSPLLQCTDPLLFHREESDAAPREEVLFVGNSRRQRRPIVMDALESRIPIAIYGDLWEGLVPPELVKATYAPNEELRRYYSNAKIVLNDHWPSMRDQGFISNRLFDAGACGALIISDPAAGLLEVFGETVVTYETPQELASLVAHYLADEGARREKGQRLAELVMREHTFERRAEVILAAAEEALRRRVSS